MKKISGFIFALVMLFTLVLQVKAVECSDNCLAQIDNVKYATLQEAVNAVPTDGTQKTITILKDAESVSGFISNSGKNYIIDFNNHTIVLGTPLVGSTGTETLNLQLLKDSTIVFKNGTLNAEKTARIMVQNYANLTIENMTLDSTGATNCSYTLSNNNGKVNIIGQTNIYSKNVAFDAYWWPKNTYVDGTQVIVNTTGVIRGIIEVDTDGTPNSKTTVTILNINHEGSFAVTQGLEENVKISGGIFNSDVSKYVIDGYKQYETGMVKEIEKETVITEITENTVVEEVTIGVSAEDKAKVNQVLIDSLNNSDLAEQLENSDIDIVLKVDKLDENAISKTVINEFNTALESKENAKIVSFFDISIAVIDENNSLLGNLTELTNNIKLTVALPQDLQTVANGYTRDYYIILNHNDKTEVIEATLSEDGKYVTFETDKFSTYALAYNDVEKSSNSATKETNPPTFDNIGVYVIGLTSAVFVSGLCLYLKKHKMSL